MIDSKAVKKIQKSLIKKTEENKRFNKKYWIENKGQEVLIHKEAIMPCYLNKLCIALFIDYYKKVLNLAFEYIEKGDKAEYISPMLQVAGKANEKANVTKTKEILDLFPIVYSKECKAMLKPNHTLKVYSSDMLAPNFFIYKGNQYLLDLEEFYFCVYDCEEKNVGLNGITEKYIERVTEYKPECILDKEGMLRENMLILK